VSLQAQLAKMDRDAGKLRGDLLMSVSRAPEVSAEYIQRYRDMKYYETLYDLLAKQYELARIDEGKNATVIQILDRAVEPDKKSGPKRALIVLLTGFAALCLTVIAAFWIEGIQNAQRHAGLREKMLSLRAHFRSL
jgi:tyrosine-protein kinase Etk/Wzc